MIKVWKKRNGRIALQLDSGMSSPVWDHWAILLHKADGSTLRVKLNAMDSVNSTCGDWKLQTTFRGLNAK